MANKGYGSGKGYYGGKPSGRPKGGYVSGGDKSTPKQLKKCVDRLSKYKG